jgi:prefoldin subunit 5
MYTVHIPELRKQIMAAQKNYMVAKDGAEAVPIAEKIRKDYNQARDLTNEKIRLSDRAMDLLQRHIKRLDDTLLEATKDVDEAALPGGQMYDATPTVDKSTLAELHCVCEN